MAASMDHCNGGTAPVVDRVGRRRLLASTRPVHDRRMSSASTIDRSKSLVEMRYVDARVDCVMAQAQPMTTKQHRHGK